MADFLVDWLLEPVFQVVFHVLVPPFVWLGELILWGLTFGRREDMRNVGRVHDC